jgi:hypothetical protein
MMPSLFKPPEVSETDTDTVGGELTVIIVEAADVDPFPDVTVTVYVVVTEGET